MTGETTARLFNPRLVVGIVLASVAAFAAFVIVLAYAPQWRGSSDGRAHALSRGGTGFAGIVKLLQIDGDRAEIIRDDWNMESEGLVVVTLDPMQDGDALKVVTELRAVRPTLYILPKWQTTPHPTMPGWVMHQGTFNTDSVAELAETVAKIEVSLPADARPAGQLQGREMLAGFRMPAPAPLQSLKGEALEPLLVTDDGRIVLAAVRDTQAYILSDPDLLNNQALGSLAGAHRAVALLDALNNSPDEPILFDVTVSGFASKRSLLKLMFEPPFAALTLVLAAAGLLAAWQAAIRFGPVRAAPRAIALGSTALVENMAGLLAMARREHLAGPGYAELLGAQAAHAAGAPSGLAGPELEAWLDRRSPAGDLYSERAEGLRQARDKTGLLAAAQSMFHWKKELTGR